MVRKIVRRIALLLLFAGITIAVSGISAHAQIAPSIAVNPEKFELSLSRGETHAEVVKITNTGKDSLPIHLRPVRWEARDEVGGINFVSTPEDPSFDIARWMKLGKNDFILKPGETERVPVTITVPKNAEPGGKYGAMFIEPTLPEFYFSKDEPHVLPQIGVLFLVTIPVVSLEGQQAPSVAFEQLSVEGRSSALSGAFSRIASLFRQPLRAFAAQTPVSVDVLSRKASSFVLRVRNDGSTHVRPSGTVTVHNLFGAEIARAELPPTTILPGKIRQFPVKLESKNIPFLPQVVEQQLAFGRYTATVVLQGVGTEPLLKTLSYWIFPWQGLLVALATLGPLGFFAFRFRARFLAALRALTRGRPTP